MTSAQPSGRRLLRAGAGMAAGTAASRLTGFVRTAALAAAIGTIGVGDAYAIAFAIPMILFDLLLQGVLQSVIVPSLVRAHKNDPDGGLAYEQRLLTLVTIVLAAVAVAAVLAAPLIIDLYTSGWTGRQRDVAIVLARFILPQIVFFGVGAVAGAMLTSRERFAAFAWAPVLNNLVVMSVFGLYMIISSAGADVDKVTGGDLALLGLGTTTGIAVQCVALLTALRRAGVGFRPRFDFRNARLGEIGQLGIWTLLYTVITQLTYLVITNLATGAGTAAQDAGVTYGAGFQPYNLAYQLFQLPYGIIAVSVMTAILPRMSTYASEGRMDALRAEFASGVRLACSVIVPAALLLTVLGPAVAVVIFGRGQTTIQDAFYVGNVLQVFGLALVPFSIFQMLLRVFYSLGDTRTPALIALVNAAVVAGLGVAASYVLPPGIRVMGLALAFALAYVAGGALAWIVAARRVGGLAGRAVAGVLGRQYAAAIPTVIIAVAALWLSHLAFGLTMLWAVVALIAGGALGGAAYLLAAHLLRVDEVRSIVGMIVRRGS